MPKRILIITTAYYPSLIGGDGVALKEITDRIDPSEIEFHMITIRFDSLLPKIEKIGNIVIHRIGYTKRNPSISDLKKFPLYQMKALFQFTAAIKALSLYKVYKYDAIWAMMAHSSGVPAILFKLVHPNIPYILSLQEGDPPEYIEHKMKPLWPLFVMAFKKADIVQTISNFLAIWARNRGFKGPLEVIPNGFNTSNISKKYSEQELTALKQEIGKKEGDIYLITVSRLVYKNAVDSVIRALSLLPRNIHLLIVGGGPDETDLKKLAKELNVFDRVVFVGQVNTNETTKYRRISEIFIRASRSEGMGNSFVSTMAAGLPVIATQEGGIADFLFDAIRNPDKPTTGWAVDKENPQQIADAVEYILHHPDEVNKIIKTAQMYVEENFDWNVIAKNMRLRVFNKALNLTGTK